MSQRLRRLGAIALIVVAVAGFYSLGGKYLWPRPNRSLIQTVGIIEAPEVDITSRIAGRIREINVVEGDRVERGQVVCQIDDIDLKNLLGQATGSLDLAEANLHDAERTMARDRELFQHKVISAKQRDDSATALERARAAVISARANEQYYKDRLADTRIESPIDGVVVNKALEVGEWVTPGTTIVTVDDLSLLWARVDVQETDLGSVRVGEPAQIKLTTNPPLVFKGVVMAIGQEGQFATQRDVRRGRQDIRTFYVKVRALQPNGRLKPGMTAEVSFLRNHGIKLSSNPHS